MQASVVNVLQLNAEKARPPLPFIAIEALLMLLPFAYLQVQTSSFFRYTFSSHYLEFHISIFRRNIFTRHRAYNVDSTTYAYVRVATTETDRAPGSTAALATYAYVRVATPKRSISLSSHTSFHMRMDFSTKRLLEFGFGFPKANPHWPLFPPSFSAPLLRFRSSGIRQIGTCPAPLKFPDRPYPVCNYQTPKLAG